jgi:hypothetical protein
MFPVEIHISDEAALPEEMATMRTWLDHSRFEPSTFQYRRGQHSAPKSADLALNALAWPLKSLSRRAPIRGLATVVSHVACRGRGL